METKEKLIFTGSSSKFLSSEIATELRGRTLTFTVYPLSFSEYLKAKNIDFNGKNILYSKERVTIKKEFNRYFQWGGFPAILQTPNPSELLKEYYRVMFYRDLVEHYNIKNIRLFEDYLTLLIDQTASHFSISSTAKKLTEIGYSLSKNTLSNFSKYAQDVFLTFEIKKHCTKIKEQLRASRKLYCIDHGLVQAVRFSLTENYGRLLENIAYISLRQKAEHIYYYKGIKECDFILFGKNKALQAVQVSKSIADNKTKIREVEGLLEALNEYQLKEGLILTEDDVDTFKIDSKTIRVLPLWYWLLNSKNITSPD